MLDCHLVPPRVDIGRKLKLGPEGGSTAHLEHVTLNIPDLVCSEAMQGRAWLALGCEQQRCSDTGCRHPKQCLLLCVCLGELFNFRVILYLLENLNIALSSHIWFSMPCFSCY